MAFPQVKEYTPELNQDYLASLLNPIEEGTASAVANVNARRRAGGLDSQASTGAEMGAIEAGALRAKSDTIGKFNFNVAGMKRGERLTNEKQAYESTEAQKERDFREHMNELAYARSVKDRESQNRANKIAGQQGMVTGALVSLGSAAAGGYFGGLGGAASSAGGGAGKSAMRAPVKSYSSMSSMDDMYGLG